MCMSACGCVWLHACVCGGAGCACSCMYCVWVGWVHAPVGGWVCMRGVRGVIMWVQGVHACAHCPRPSGTPAPSLLPLPTSSLLYLLLPPATSSLLYLLLPEPSYTTAPPPSSPSLPPALLLLLYPLLPESPRYLLVKGQTAAAEAVLQRMAAANGKLLPAGRLVSGGGEGGGGSLHVGWGMWHMLGGVCGTWYVWGRVGSLLYVWGGFCDSCGVLG